MINFCTFCCEFKTFKLILVQGQSVQETELHSIKAAIGDKRAHVDILERQLADLQTERQYVGEVCQEQKARMDTVEVETAKFEDQLQENARVLYTLEERYQDLLEQARIQGMTTKVLL